VSSSFQAELGRIYWKPVRNAVMQLRHDGYRIEVEEGQGFLSRPFFVRGDAAAVEALNSWLRRITGDER
jgi:hypothetical protein